MTPPIICKNYLPVMIIELSSALMIPV